MPSIEIIVAILTALAIIGGFAGWLTKVSFDLGSIRALLEFQVNELRERVNIHSDALDDHSTRITVVETTLKNKCDKTNP
jgi:hypothetical protein